MNAALARAFLAALLLCSATACTVPTLAQREQAWRTHRDTQRLICASGLNTDPAMPDDVRDWCRRSLLP